MGNCATHKRNTGSSYYFNTGLENEYFQMISGEVMENGAVSLGVKLIKNNTNFHSNSFKVEILYYKTSQRQNPFSLGSTEVKSFDPITEEIRFDKFYTMPYYFEKQQLIDVRIFKDKKIETIETSMGNIMGGRRQTFKKVLKDNIILEIHGEEIKKSEKNITFDISLNGKFLKANKLQYQLYSLGTLNNPLNKILYDSEIKDGIPNQPIKFCKCEIPEMYLKSTKEEETMILIVFNDKKSGKNLGEFRGELTKLISDVNTTVEFTKKTDKALIKCELVTPPPSFISYLKEGMEINLVIGIDFTGSNGEYDKSYSLHYIGGGKNDYEKSIKSCGDIVAYYDHDQLFPVYGFGFDFKYKDNLELINEKYTTLNFPINLNLEKPEINTIDNILVEYRKFIKLVELSGPTHFSPIIKELNDKVIANIDKGEEKNYYVLMLLTDGQIGDMKDTIDSLVEASFLPISVIIIGIGNGSFENMGILDADDNPLLNRQKIKADRDLVQFVLFNDYKNDPEKLAEQVLEEVPRQVCEYYEHRKKREELLPDLAKFSLVKMEINEGNNLNKINFDLIYLVDATGSMSNSIEKVKTYCIEISKKLNNKFTKYDFSCGGIFYRDPVDCSGDKNDYFDLSKDINSFQEFVKKMSASGGGDIPEDWVGGYSIAINNIKWRDGIKLIIHLADAGAHGIKYSSNDSRHNDQAKLLDDLIEQCINRNIGIVGFNIGTEATKSFEVVKNAYAIKGKTMIIKAFDQNNNDVGYFIDLVIDAVDMFA